MTHAIIDPGAVSIHLNLKFEWEKAVTYLEDEHTTLATVMGAFGPVTQLTLFTLGVGFSLLRLQVFG